MNYLKLSITHDIPLDDGESVPRPFTDRRGRVRALSPLPERKPAVDAEPRRGRPELAPETFVTTWTWPFVTRADCAEALKRAHWKARQLFRLYSGHVSNAQVATFAANDLGIPVVGEPVREPLQLVDEGAA